MNASSLPPWLGYAEGRAEYLAQGGEQGMAEDRWGALWNAEWEPLINAADSAGGQAARRMAQRCSCWELGRTGQVVVHVAPAESPVATWLHRSGRSQGLDEQGVRVAIAPSFRQLFPAAWAARKSRSLLVRQAYATSFCTVLAHEAGVKAEVSVRPDPISPEELRTTVSESLSSPIPSQESILAQDSASDEDSLAGQDSPGSEANKANL